MTDEALIAVRHAYTRARQYVRFINGGGSLEERFALYMSFRSACEQAKLYHTNVLVEVREELRQRARAEKNQ